MKHLAKILPVFLALAMLFCLGCSVNAESITSADATTMRLMRTDGTVLLADGSGSLSVQEGMRLFSGYALSTEALSRAGIMLDDYKAVTLNELSKASLQEEGKKLELNLENGAMYFCVSKPLDADESYSIRTSTMVLGIRGTSGYVETLSDTKSSVILTSGNAVISILTGGELPISPGQRIIISSAGGGTQFSSYMISPDDYPGLLLSELISDRQILDEADAQNGNGFKTKVLDAAVLRLLQQGDFSLFAGRYTASVVSKEFSDLTLNADGTTEGGTKNGVPVWRHTVPLSVSRAEDGSCHCVVTVTSTPDTYEYYDIYPNGVSTSSSVAASDSSLTSNIVIHYVVSESGTVDEAWYKAAGDNTSYESFVVGSTTSSATPSVADEISYTTSVTWTETAVADNPELTEGSSSTAVSGTTTATGSSGTSGTSGTSSTSGTTGMTGGSSGTTGGTSGTTGGTSGTTGGTSSTTGGTSGTTGGTSSTTGGTSGTTGGTSGTTGGTSGTTGTSGSDPSTPGSYEEAIKELEDLANAIADGSFFGSLTGDTSNNNTPASPSGDTGNSTPVSPAGDTGNVTPVSDTGDSTPTNNTNTNNNADAPSYDDTSGRVKDSTGATGNDISSAGNNTGSSGVNNSPAANDIPSNSDGSGNNQPVDYADNNTPSNDNSSSYGDFGGIFNFDEIVNGFSG